jgi:hypothetical protein
MEMFGVVDVVVLVEYQIQDLVIEVELYVIEAHEKHLFCSVERRCILSINSLLSGSMAQDNFVDEYGEDVSVVVVEVEVVLQIVLIPHKSYLHIVLFFQFSFSPR